MSCVYLVVTRDVALPVWDVADSNPEHLQEMTALFFTSLLFGWFFFLNAVVTISLFIYLFFFTLE